MPISTELLIFTRHVQRHLQKRVQALFWKPTTDVYRCEDGWLLKLELGVKPTDIELHTRHNFFMHQGQSGGCRIRSGFSCAVYGNYLR